MAVSPEAQEAAVKGHPRPGEPTLTPASEILITRADINLCFGSGELKTCPHCGSQAMSSGKQTPNGKAICWTILCLEDKCCASVWGTHPDQDKAREIAVAKWNRRKIAPFQDFQPSQVAELDLVGIAEVAILMGNSRQAAHNVVRRAEDFPAPFARLKMGPIWHKATVLDWINLNRKTK